MANPRKKPIEMNPQIEDAQIHSPLELPEAAREAYWNGLLQDIDQLRAATATMPFWRLLNVIPPALWEKRLLMYLYRTAPKIKNQVGERSYIEKITQPIDEEYIKQNHGGGSYTLWLNIDRDTNLKQVNFSIDGPPKFKQGQSLVDAEGNLVPITAAAAPTSSAVNGNGPSEVAQAIEATTEANRIAVETVSKGADAAVQLQTRILERAVGLNNKTDSTDKMLELLMNHVLNSKTTQADPMTTALTLMDKLESIIARRLPAESEPKHETPLGEVNTIVEGLTGSPLSDLVKKNTGRTDDTPGWVGLALGVAGKLMDNLPVILERFSQLQQMNFQRALIMQGAGRALPPAQAAPGAQAGPVTAMHVPPAPSFSTTSAPAAAPVATVISPQQPVTANAEPTTPAATSISSDLDNLAQQTIAATNMIAVKFREGYTGEAVAQALDVLYPDLLQQMAPAILKEDQLSVLIDGFPALAACKSNPEWQGFLDSFVDWVRGEMEENTPAPAKMMAVQPATA